MRRRDLVAKELANACTSPASFSEFFAQTDLEDVRKTRLMSLSAAGPQTELACAQWPKVAQRLSTLPAQQRHAAAFEDCKLARFDLIDARQWQDAHSTSLVPFAAAAWLQEQGASKATTKTIAKAMLLRDRQIWSRADQTIASTVYPLPAVPRGSIVHVTTSAVFVGDEEVGSVEDNGHFGNRWSGALEPALGDRIDEDATALLVADATADAHLVMQMVRTLAGLGFGSVGVVAKNRPLEFGAAAVRAHVDTTTVLRVKHDSFRLEHDGRVLPIAATKGEDTHDYAELARTLSKEVRDGPLVVTVGVDGDVNAETLLNVFSALYHASCGSTEAACETPPQIGLQDRAREVALNSGILGVLSAEGSSGVFGSESSLGAAPLFGSGEELTEAFGAGGLGLHGSGGGGFGGGGSTGLGTIGSGRSAKRVPRVRQAKAKVEGGLDRDIVRRIVRAHINEVRKCYDVALEDDPDLEDRVTVSFTIGASGKVASASATSRESNEGLESCLGKAAKRWKFPKPIDGADVEVEYPFVLSPG